MRETPPPDVGDFGKVVRSLPIRIMEVQASRAIDRREAGATVLPLSRH
jgi:hypothetical protein